MRQFCKQCERPYNGGLEAGRCLSCNVFYSIGVFIGLFVLVFVVTTAFYLARRMFS